MTIQTMEKLIYKGRVVNMATNPLTSYIMALEIKPNFCSIASGCWRGYVGTWLIEDNKLYLVDIKGYARKNPDSIEPIDLYR